MVAAAAPVVPKTTNVRAISRKYGSTAYRRQVRAINTLKALYRSHEGPGIIRWQVNGGGVQTLNVAQTGVNEYILVTLGTASLNAGSNTVSLSSGQGFVCFKQACIQSALRQGVVEETTTDEVLTLYPNPTDGRVTVRYQLAKGEVATLRFVTVSGQVLERKALVGEGDWQQHATDLSAQPDGIYTVLLETQTKISSRKFVIAK